MRPATGWMPNVHVDAAFGEGVVEFADFVLGLGDGHAVSGNDDDFVGGGENCRRLLRAWRCAPVAASCAPAAVACYLAEGAEEHVGERAVHGLRHDDGEDEAGGAVERAGDDQQLAVEHESHGRGGKSGVGVQQRDDGGHVGAADGNDHHHAEDQRDDDHRRETGTCGSGCSTSSTAMHDGDGQQAEVDEVLSFIGDGALRQDFLQLAGGHQAAGEGERAEDDLQREHAPS